LVLLAALVRIIIPTRATHQKSDLTHNYGAIAPDSQTRAPRRAEAAPTLALQANRYGIRFRASHVSATKFLPIDAAIGYGHRGMASQDFTAEELRRMLTLSKRYLELELAAHRGTGGVSGENRHLGFVPAFLDTYTGKVYPCAYADGRPANFHLLDGLPDDLVVARDRGGRPSQVVGSVVTGFTLDNRFYTREQAAAQVAGPETCIDVNG